MGFIWNVMLLSHYFVSAAYFTKITHACQSRRTVAYFIQILSPATYTAYVWCFCDVLLAYLVSYWFQAREHWGVCMAYVWRIMRCCGITVLLAWRFILTCNVATAYIAYMHRKQLLIKAPMCTALLLFFPKQSRKSREKYYASKEATPRKHQGKRKKISRIHRIRPSGTISCHSRDPAAAPAWDRSMTVKRMRTNKNICLLPMIVVLT